MKLALTIMAALACLSYDRTCLAADRLVGDIYTKHSSPCEEAYSKVCNRWGQPHRLSWEHDLSTDGAFSSDVGIGTNSYGNLSLNIGGLWQPVKIGPVRAGVFASLVSGYTCEQLRTCVIVAGLAGTYEWEKAVIQVLYVPAVGQGTVAVWQLRGGLSF